MGKYSGKTCRLLCMLALTASFFLVEIVVGYITNSLALVGDSYHMLSDVVALLVGFASVRIAKWPRDVQRNTFGWARAEVLGALVNSVFLMALCFTIFVEALQRMFHDEHIHDPDLMLIVGSLGLAINLVGLCLFHGHGHSHGGGGEHGHGHSHSHVVDDIKQRATEEEKRSLSPGTEDKALGGSVVVAGGTSMTFSDLNDDNISVTQQMHSSAHLNMRGVFLHVLGDALGSVVVIISALVIKFETEEWRYKIDPAMSMVMVVIILSTTIPLLRESAMILLQTVPTHIQVKHLQDKLLEKVDGVLGIHEFHVWQLAGNRIIASAHIRCQNLRNYMLIAEKVKTFFHNEGIHSTTIQPEFIEDDLEEADPIRSNRNSCLLFSCKDDACNRKRCCSETEEDQLLHAKNKHTLGACGTSGDVTDENLNKNNRADGTVPNHVHGDTCHCQCKTPVFNLHCEVCGGSVFVEGAFSPHYSALPPDGHTVAPQYSLHPPETVCVEVNEQAANHRKGDTDGTPWIPANHTLDKKSTSPIHPSEKLLPTNTAINDNLSINTDGEELQPLTSNPSNRLKSRSTDKLSLGSRPSLKLSNLQLDRSGDDNVPLCEPEQDISYDYEEQDEEFIQFNLQS